MVKNDHVTMVLVSYWLTDIMLHQGAEEGSGEPCGVEYFIRACMLEVNSGLSLARADHVTLTSFTSNRVKLRLRFT